MEIKNVFTNYILLKRSTTTKNEHMKRNDLKCCRRRVRVRKDYKKKRLQTKHKNKRMQMGWMSGRENDTESKQNKMNKNRRDSLTSSKARAKFSYLLKCQASDGLE